MFNQAMLGDGVVVTLSDMTIFDFDVLPGGAFAEYQLRSNGDIIRRTADALTDMGDWINPPSAAGANYTVTASVQSGPDPTGDLVETPLSLGSNRAWRITQNFTGSTTAVLLITIRHAVTGRVMGTCTVTLQAEAEAGG